MRVRNDMYLLALHGEPGAGKDTLADYLVREEGFTQVTFADALYEEVAAAFNVTVPFLRDRETKLRPQARLRGTYCRNMEYAICLRTMGIPLNEPRTSRFHLRNYAEAYRRSQYENYWVGAASSALERAKGDIVVSDLRHINEYEALKSFAKRTGRIFGVIEIKGWSHAETSTHTSDQRLPDECLELVVKNVEGQPEDMCQVVVDYFQL